MLWLLAASALAGVLGTWGGGEAGLAGNAATTAAGPYAAWSNPAAMSSPGVEGAAEYVAGGGRLAWEDAPDPCVAPTDGLLLGTVLNGYWFRLPFAHVGAALFVPREGPFRWYEPAEGNADKDVEPTTRFPRFQEDLARMDAAIAANVRIADRMGIGIGLDASADILTLTYVEIDDLEHVEDARKGQDVEIGIRFFPYAGALLEAGPGDGWHARIGLVGRAARYMDDHGTSYLDLLPGEGGEYLYRHAYIRYWAPATSTVGLALANGTGPELRVEMSREKWSDAPGPYGETLDPAWHDTTTARFGVAQQVGPVRLSGGYGWDPGPETEVPEGTAYLDGPSHQAGIGAGIVLRTPGRPILVFAGLQRRWFPDVVLGGHDFGGTMWASRVGVQLAR